MHQKVARSWNITVALGAGCHREREPKNKSSATCSKRLLGEYHATLIFK